MTSNLFPRIKTTWNHNFRRRLFIAVALVLFIYGFANYTGFCFREMHYLSDREKLNTAMRHFGAVGTKPKCATVSSSSDPEVNHIICTYPYASLDEFVKKNPHCCKIIRGDDNKNEDGPPRFADRIFGVFNYVVEAEYMEKNLLTDKDDRDSVDNAVARNLTQNKNHQEKKVRRRQYFGNCGEPCEEVRSKINLLFSFLASALPTCCYID